MKGVFKILIMFAPVFLVFGQVAANLLYLAAPFTYAELYPYIATIFGMNLVGAILMVAITYIFKFCAVSRAAAVAEVIFCLVYMLIPDKDMYNISVQIIVGVAALLMTLISIVIETDKQWTPQQ